MIEVRPGGVRKVVNTLSVFRRILAQERLERMRLISGYIFTDRELGVNENFNHEEDDYKAGAS